MPLYRGWSLLDEVLLVFSETTTSPNPSTKYGETPLHFASCNGHLEVVKMILDAIEDNGDLNPKDKFGNTPLHEAAREGHYEVGRIALSVSPKLFTDWLASLIT